MLQTDGGVKFIFAWNALAPPVLLMVMLIANVWLWKRLELVILTLVVFERIDTDVESTVEKVIDVWLILLWLSFAKIVTLYSPVTNGV